MARKRFNAEEKALLVAGTPVEWQNVAQWHPGVILGPMRTTDGWQVAPMRNLATTRTLSPPARFGRGRPDRKAQHHGYPADK